jgi:DNA polymerase I-like protein with 3'-5' exonuclease and polymerase domains
LAAAATADNLNLGMWRVWKHMPQVQLLAQVHDAIYFQFREGEDANAIVRQAQSLMTVELNKGNRKFIVPTEAKLGKNWGNFSEKNQQGLKKFYAT